MLYIWFTGEFCSFKNEETVLFGFASSGNVISLKHADKNANLNIQTETDKRLHLSGLRIKRDYLFMSDMT